jgi:hypothetical protein
MNKAQVNISHSERRSVEEFVNVSRTANINSTISNLHSTSYNPVNEERKYNQEQTSMHPSPSKQSAPAANGHKELLIPLNLFESKDELNKIKQTRVFFMVAMMVSGKTLTSIGITLQSQNASRVSFAY